MKALFDTHIHSCYSVDSDQSLEGILQAARALGLCAVSLTDHYDIDMAYTGFYEQVLDEGYNAISSLRSKTLGSKTEILCGIELGCAVCDEPLARDILCLHDYDIVISSLHGIKGQDEYYCRPWNKMSSDEIDNLLFQYYEHLLRQAKQGLFDTLAHLDYPTRYIRRQGVKFSPNKFADLTDEILKTLANSGKALEINTSGLCDVFNSTLPGADVIRRFYELGGEYVTYGSDAHTADRIGEGFDTAQQIARSAGFKYLTYYKNRKPCAVKID